MLLTKKSKTLVKIIHRRLLEIIRLYQNSNIIDTTIDPENKILSFITYFIYLELRLADITTTINLLDQYQVIVNYLTMIQNIAKFNQKQAIVTAVINHQIDPKEIDSLSLTYGKPLIEAIQALLKNKGTELATNHIMQLIDLIIKLFLINYSTPQLRKLAKSNLNDQYDKNIEFIIFETSLVAEIHKMLRTLTKNNMNALVIYINYLLKPLKR